MASCSTCATLLPRHHEATSSWEKALDDRTVSCCGRIICGECIQKNSRFSTYCPYCQISNSPTSLPQRLRDPPSYTLLPSSTTTVNTSPFEKHDASTLPPYTPTATATETVTATTTEPLDPEKKPSDPPEHVLHFLNHDLDSITSLSLRYNVPPAALRRANHLGSDHLLGARRTIYIPGGYCHGGVSLSPRPVNGEAEERRKSQIRRFMTSCKVSNYDVAVLYLEQSGYDLGASVEAYLGDEAWEREHPHPRHGGGTGTSSRHVRNQGPCWRKLGRGTS
ncbi:hypothetical protein E4U43_008333 [Claviceps pusilla]|uniref:LysM domain-containing protein n=1 Tax=Claviceps pusilla TaxID=123648 RepID=A0A9P7SYC2_9HYPO|nr:hypothetical protein E4U43_008333 [Claviceps pusilla]